MLSIIPLLFVTGAAMSTTIAKLASQAQTAYAEVSVVVEQTIGSIRTVASFTGEKQFVNKYSKSLKSAYNSAIKNKYLEVGR